jgi:hypothetical protein
VVSRREFFALFGADGRLLWKRLWPMEFACVEHDAFERMARGVGFDVTERYGSCDGSAFDPVASPVTVLGPEEGWLTAFARRRE